MKINKEEAMFRFLANCVVLVSLLAASACVNRPQPSTTVVQPVTQKQQPVSAGTPVITEVGGGMAPSEAILGLCWSEPAPVTGVLPMTWKADVPDLLEAGTYRVDSLTQANEPPPAYWGLTVASIPVVWLMATRLDAWTSGAPASLKMRLLLCNQEQCGWHFKVGSQYGLILSHPTEAPSTAGGTFHMIPLINQTLRSAATFRVKLDGTWTNGQIGAIKGIPYDILKAGIATAIAQVKATGTCTVDLPADKFPQPASPDAQNGPPQSGFVTSSTADGGATTAPDAGSAPDPKAGNTDAWSMSP